MSRSTPVYLEVTARRTFAGAIEWPGWCRNGRTEDDALEALFSYAGRYASVVKGSVAFEPPSGPEELDPVERLTGGKTTEFGAPEVAPAADGRSLDDAELTRQRAILRACWRAFDAAADAAIGKTLRTGPRGGGRTPPKIRTHVTEAEVAYLSQLGARFKPGDATDAAGAADADGSSGGDPVVAALRDAVLAALTARARDEPVPNANAVKKLWLPRFFVRRAAWHVLDHAWEIEDRQS